jgi:hypothetical protein
MLRRLDGPAGDEILLAEIARLKLTWRARRPSIS